MASAFVQTKQSFEFFQPDHSIEYWAIRNDGIDKKTDVIWTYQYSFPDVFEMVQISNFLKRYSRFIISPMLLILFWGGTKQSWKNLVAAVAALGDFFSPVGDNLGKICKWTQKFYVLPIKTLFSTPNYPFLTPICPFVASK